MIDININLPENYLLPEIRNGYEVTLERKKVWAVELDLLTQLDNVCKKFGLRYYADSGTLLGTVRDKGFIPWDDDIDVVMFRKDYDYLIQNCGGEFSHPYFLQSAYSDKNYYRGHAQLRNSETTAMLPNEALVVEFNQGIFLDIFPLDYVPLNEKEEIKIAKTLLRYRRSFNERIWGVGNVNTYSKIVKTIRRSYFLRGGKHNAFRRFEKKCMRPNGKYLDKVSYYEDISRYKHIPAEWFGEPILMDFEFMKIPVPGKYDEILKKYYGEDYLLPQIKEAGHQKFGDIIVDPEIPYTAYIIEMRSNKNETD